MTGADDMTGAGEAITDTGAAVDVVAPQHGAGAATGAEATVPQQDGAGAGAGAQHAALRRPKSRPEKS